MTDKAWKNAERRVAKRLGGRRVGASGEDTCDITHPLLAIEVKWRTTLPKWALDCLEQVRTARNTGYRVSAVVLLQKRMRAQDGLVVLRLSDFEQLFGAITGADSTPGDRS